MGRPAKKPHDLKLRLRTHSGSAVCHYQNVEYVFGKWDMDLNVPTREALEKFQRQVARWSIDPNAPFAEEDEEEPFLATLWADWVASPHAPTRHEVGLAAKELFGTSDEQPGPYRYTKVRNFLPVDLHAWQERLCTLTAKGKDGQPRLRLGRDMVTRYVGYVRKCFAWAVSCGRVDHLHAASLSLVVPPAPALLKPTKKRRGIEEKAYTAVVPRLSPPLRAVVELLRLSCARPSEVLGLRGEDIRKGGKHRVDSGVEIDLDALGVWATLLQEHKTEAAGYDRVIFWGPRSRAILELFLATYPRGYLFRPADGQAHAQAKNEAARKRKRKTSGRTARVNDRYDHHALCRAVRRACDQAGVTPWTPYQIRHQSLKDVQGVYGREGARVYAGHQVGGVTERYAGADLKLAARIAAERG